jgi:nucleoside phosphorylase
MLASEIKGNVDFGIITIREDEFEAVLQRFPDKVGLVSGLRHYNIRKVALGASELYNVAIVRCVEQGNTEAQAAAHALLVELAPRWLLVVGIAGGAPATEFTLGDVVVSTRIADFSVEAALAGGEVEHALGGGPIHAEAAKLAANLPALKDELGRWNAAESIGVPRPGVVVPPTGLYGDPDWQAKVRRVIEHHFAGAVREPKVTAGAIASSDRLIKDAELLKVWLRISRQVVAVEMESAGAYRAAHDQGVPFLAVRGISDVVGLRRDAGWTSYACHTAAAFTHALLRARPIPPRP